MAALENGIGIQIKRMIGNHFSNGTRTIDFNKTAYYHCRSLKVNRDGIHI